MKSTVKKISISVLAFLLMTVAIAACGQPAAPAAAPAPAAGTPAPAAPAGSAAPAPAAAGSKYTAENPLIIEVASAARYTPGIDPYSCAFDFINEKLITATNGSIQMEFKGGGQLATSENDAVNGLNLGTIQSTIFVFTMVESIAPELTVMGLPYLFEDYQALDDFLLNAPAADTIRGVIEQRFNCKVVSLWIGGAHTWGSNPHPIIAPQDAQGVKMRIAETPYGVELLQTIGANPTPMSIADTIVGLQQGTMDALNASALSLYTTGMYEFIKYLTFPEYGSNTNGLLIRNDIYNELTPQQQEALLAAGREFSETWTVQLIENEAQIIEEFANRGTIDMNYTVDKAAFRETMMPMYSSYRSIIGEELFDSVINYMDFEIE